MKAIWIKRKNDNKNFKIQEKIGLKVINLENPEAIDEKIKELIKNNYKTIFLSNEIASFSEDIIKKYNNSDDINIIISKRK